MTLPALEWRRLPAQALGGSTVEDILNAIFNAGQSATYADGEARTPGSGSAWTYARFQNGGTTEAVHCTPPTGDVDDLRVILAGVDVGAPTPTMRTPDTFAAGHVLASINKNSGAFNAWDNAAPFTSGQFFGYWRAFNAGGGPTYDTVDVYESQEAIVVVVRNGVNMTPVFLGCWVDSGSALAADSEDGNGRVYGVANNDPSGDLDVDFLENNTNKFLAHTNLNDNYHVGFFEYGATTNIRTAEKANLLDSNPAAGATLPSGSPISFPIMLKDASGAPVIGVMRQMQALAQSAQYLQVINDSGGTEAAFLLAASQSSADNALALYK